MSDPRIYDTPLTPPRQSDLLPVLPFPPPAPTWHVSQSCQKRLYPSVCEGVDCRLIVEIICSLKEYIKLLLLDLWHCVNILLHCWNSYCGETRLGAPSWSHSKFQWYPISFHKNVFKRLQRQSTFRISYISVTMKLTIKNMLEKADVKDALLSS